MSKRDIQVSIILGIILLISLWGIFWVKPQTINNNYNISVPSELIQQQTDYRLNVQLEAYKKDLREEYNKNIADINTKFNALLAVLGIAVMVWVGLNIYSIVDRREIDKLIAQEATLRKQLDEQTDEVNRLSVKIEEINRKLINKNKKDRMGVRS